MASFYKKAVVWLGLNEEYPDALHVDNGSDAHDDFDAEYSAVPQDGDPVSSPGPQPEAASTTVRAVPLETDRGEDPLAPKAMGEDRDSTTVRAYPMNDSTSTSRSAGGSGTVRAVPMGKSAAPETVIPASYNNAQDVADVFKDGKPVVVDLQSAERDLSRRLIDFSAGLCYGLGGRMEKLKSDVYLLIPDGVEVSNEDKDRLR